MVVAAVAVGAAAGWLIRVRLATLRRGVVLRAGIPEAASAALAGVGVALSWPAPGTAMVVWAGLLAVALGAVDIVHHRLPDALTIPAIPITLLLVAATESAAPDTGSVLRAVVVAAGLGGLFWALAALAPRAMGLGDAKLMPSLALLTGFVSVAAAVLAVVVAFLLGAVAALLGLLLRRLTLTTAIPFGPFLLAGCWLVLAVPGLVTVVIG